MSVCRIRFTVRKLSDVLLLQFTFFVIFLSLIGLKINQNPDKNLYCATEFLQAIYLLCNITSDFRHEFCFIDFHVTRTNNRTNDHIDLKQSILILSKVKPHAINSSTISRSFFGSKWAKNLQRKYLMILHLFHPLGEPHTTMMALSLQLI